MRKNDKKLEKYEKNMRTKYQKIIYNCIIILINMVNKNKF